MSILCESAKGWVLDHPEFIKNVYFNCDENSEEKLLLKTSFKSFIYNENLFKIVTPFFCNLQATRTELTKTLKRKRLHNTLVSTSPELLIVKSALEQLVSLAKQQGFFISSPTKEDFAQNNQEARNCSTTFFGDFCQDKLTTCSGGNVAKRPVLVEIGGQSYLIPNDSKFFCCDLQGLNLSENNKFDFVLLDPPWWNKYVRRRKAKQETAGYKMMYNEEVCSLPVESWLAPDALVAVWCTNCERHTEDIIAHWFPRWGLHHIATWYWVKVTCSGQPVCQFSPPLGKQPYERILFGATGERRINLPPDKKCIISVPSAIHSHKPPLSEVLKPYLPDMPKCLELFARYLLPHWTSAGDQVLALQNLKLFTQIKKTHSRRSAIVYLHMVVTSRVGCQSSWLRASVPSQTRLSTSPTRRAASSHTISRPLTRQNSLTSCLTDSPSPSPRLNTWHAVTS